MEDLVSTMVDESQDSRLTEPSHLASVTAGMNGKRQAEVESASASSSKKQKPSNPEPQDEPRRTAGANAPIFFRHELGLRRLFRWRRG